MKENRKGKLVEGKNRKMKTKEECKYPNVKFLSIYPPTSLKHLLYKKLTKFKYETRIQQKMNKWSIEMCLYTMKKKIKRK